MTTALIAASILGTAAAVHVYWAAGGRRGFDAAVPHVVGKRLFTPGKAVTFAVAVGLVMLAGLVLWRDGLIVLPLPWALARYGVPLMALAFAARAIGDFRHVGWSKCVRGSTFARLDDVLYAPLCLLLAICFIVVGMS